MYTNNRDAYRQTFHNAWQKYQKQLPLEAVEVQLVEVILLHPEYIALIEKFGAMERQEFDLEENPFFHLSLHIAIKDQIRTNRPAGISELYKTLCDTHEDHHEVEHKMMACLARLMWDAQQTGVMASEENYLISLNNLAK